MGGRCVLHLQHGVQKVWKSQILIKKHFCKLKNLFLTWTDGMSRSGTITDESFDEFVFLRNFCIGIHFIVIARELVLDFLTRK